MCATPLSCPEPCIFLKHFPDSKMNTFKEELTRLGDKNQTLLYSSEHGNLKKGITVIIDAQGR